MINNKRMNIKNKNLNFEYKKKNTEMLFLMLTKEKFSYS